MKNEGHKNSAAHSIITTESRPREYFIKSDLENGEVWKEETYLFETPK